MKLMKKIKSGLIGLGLVIPVASVVGVVASCGKKETPPAAPPNFTDFTKAAEHESMYKIVQQTKPSPDWIALKESDLTAGNFEIRNQTIIFDISVKSKTQTAIFSAIYITDTAYNISDWDCSYQPDPTVSWATFLKVAKANGPKVTFVNIQLAQPEWVNIDLKHIKADSFSIDDNMNNFSDNAKDSLSLALIFTSTTTPFKINKTINLTIHFHNTAYNEDDWTAPDYTFQDFTSDTQESVLTDSWKNFAVHSKLNWNVADCDFDQIVVAKNSLIVKIYNKLNFTTINATITFRNENNKVWIYGEQMGASASAAGAWVFNGKVTDYWSKFKDDTDKWSHKTSSDPPIQPLSVLAVLKNLENTPNFNITWKSHIDNPIIDDDWTVDKTNNKNTDETNHIMYYTVALLTTDNTLDLSIHFDSKNPQLALNSFKIDKWNN